MPRLFLLIAHTRQKNLSASSWCSSSEHREDATRRGTFPSFPVAPRHPSGSPVPLPRWVPLQATIQGRMFLRLSWASASADPMLAASSRTAGARMTASLRTSLSRSEGSRLAPLLLLQLRHTATMFRTESLPPFDFGTTWSVPSAFPPQYRHRLPCRTIIARRISLLGLVSGIWASFIRSILPSVLPCFCISVSSSFCIIVPCFPAGLPIG